MSNKYIVKEDMICPITKEHCDDECCPVGSECNLSAAGSQVSAEVKEEAQKALNYICNELGNLNEHTGQDVGIETQLPIAKSVLQKFIDNSTPKEEKEDWISVATPPGSKGVVLTYDCENEGYGVAWYNSTAKEFVSWGVSIVATHWMPLPAPPKEAEQNDKM